MKQSPFRASGGRGTIRSSMAAAAAAVGRPKRLPVFVSPDELQFVSEEESSHKQILTLFNPYDFNIRFKVRSNAPHKFTVMDSQGVMTAGCFVDLVVCHRLANIGPYNVSDKLRIELFHNHRDSGGGKPIGWKLITASLLKYKSDQQSFGESATDGMNDFTTSLSSSSPLPPFSPSHQRAKSGSSILLLMAALICLLVLLLPLHGEQPEWSAYLHITVNQKLIAAFALGLLTLAILKS